MIGQSFAPIGSDDPERLNRPPGGGGQNDVQEAIKILSLRIPRAVSGGGPIPGGLMGAAGGSGLLGIINQILGGGGIVPGGIPGGGLTATPPPRVIPGIDTGEPVPGSFHPGGFDDEPVAPPPLKPLGGAGQRPMPMTGTNGRRQPPTY